MSYTPTTWQSGDVITSTKLNKLEQGVADSIMIVECTTTSPYTLDHTFSEIFETFRSNIPVYIRVARDAGSDWSTKYSPSITMAPILYIYKYGNTYRIRAASAYGAYFSDGGTLATPGIDVYEAQTATSYPTFVKKVYASSSSCGTQTQP